MQILIVHNTLNDSRSVSGVLRHYAWMANEWNAGGHRVDFLVAKAGFPQLQELAPTAKLISSDGVFDATKYLARTWRYFPAYAYRMATAHWTRFPVKYDVIYASTQLIVEVYAARVVARRQRAKLVAKVHHVLASQKERTGLFDRLFLWSERTTARWLNREADLVICGTPLVAEDYHSLERRLGLRRRETANIGYGIDLDAMPFNTDIRKDFDAVALGRIHEHKGVFDLPLLWKEIVTRRPGSRLLVIGEGPHRERAQALFAELGLAQLVKFTGGISEKEKNLLLPQCRVGLSLSYEEGWGLSINEFLAAGLPVVAYDLPIYHHVFPGQLELSKPGDWRIAAEKLLVLLDHSEIRREQGLRNRNFVSRYDYRKVAEEELSALKKLFA